MSFFRRHKGKLLLGAAVGAGVSVAAYYFYDQASHAVKQLLAGPVEQGERSKATEGKGGQSTNRQQPSHTEQNPGDDGSRIEAKESQESTELQRLEDFRKALVVTASSLLQDRMPSLRECTVGRRESAKFVAEANRARADKNMSSEQRAEAKRQAFEKLRHAVVAEAALDIIYLCISEAILVSTVFIAGRLVDDSKAAVHRAQVKEIFDSVHEMLVVSLPDMDSAITKRVQQTGSTYPLTKAIDALGIEQLLREVCWNQTTWTCIEQVRNVVQSAQGLAPVIKTDLESVLLSDEIESVVNSSVSDRIAQFTATLSIAESKPLVSHLSAIQASISNMPYDSCSIVVPAISGQIDAIDRVRGLECQSCFTLRSDALVRNALRYDGFWHTILVKFGCPSLFHFMFI